MTYVLLLAGLILLVIGGELLIRASVAGAVKLAIAPMIIGLTVIAFGTSAPELVVSVDAALLGSPEIALGNVVGSNIANILLVLGLPSMIAVTICDQPFGKRNASFLLAITVVFALLCLQSPLTVWHGLILLGLLLGFFAMSLHSLRSTASGVDSETEDMVEHARYLVERPALMIVTLLLGLALLPIGAHMTVGAAQTLAMQYGVSERVIGLSLVAIGTSLPEIVTTVVAAFRGQSGLALGNAIGSCVFNLLAILGITTLVAPIDVPASFFDVDIWVLLIAASMPLIFIAARRDLGFMTGLVFVLIYVAYMVSLFAEKPNAQSTAYESSALVQSELSFAHVS